MARKNIFQLVEENYNIQDEIEKINDLFYETDYFSNAKCGYTLYELIDEYLLEKWRYRQTCLDVDEYLERANAELPNRSHEPISEDIIINFLEVIENFLKLYFDNATPLLEKYRIKPYNSLHTTFRMIVSKLEKHMGLTIREYQDKIILYPKNAPLEKVIELCEDEDVQWELIRYVREDLSLNEKRKTLAYLATNLYIEDDPNEQNDHIKALVSKAGNVLNNLHIRHNNKTGKWENKALEDLEEQDAITLCDMVYNEMLTIVLLREHKEYEKIYSDFSKKQKEARAKKKAESK